MAQSKREWRITGVILFAGAALTGYAVTRSWWGALLLATAVGLAAWVGNAVGRRRAEARGRRSADE